jgi:hypothetical protein
MGQYNSAKKLIVETAQWSNASFLPGMEYRNPSRLNRMAG